LNQVCAIDFNVDDTAQSIAALLVRLRPVTDALASGAQLPTINATTCQYLGPDAAAILAALWLRARAYGRTLAVALPQSPVALASFCRFVGLEQLLSGGPAPDRDHPENETHPITVARGSPGLWTQPIVTLVRRHAEMGDDEEEYLRIGLHEVLQNVEDHARSSIGAVLCGKYFSASKQVRIAIVDGGEGVLAALRRTNPQLPDTKTALQKIIQGGYSSKSRDTNMGLGISNLAQFVRHLKGSLVIVSGDAIAETRSDKPVRVQSRPGMNYQGTGVFFSMRVVR
jgi:hypothetical protein